jgi:hypothetical protein
VAVDPDFLFDFEPKKAPGTELHQVTSDAYFTDIAGGQVFDFMFLDGLHEFEQTFRDFCSSQAHAHSRTVWLIDDTVPSDVYSAWPDNEKAVQLRKKAGGTGGAWHGDIFKVVFAIHDFFPTLSYVTISTGGNSQTLVWKEPRTNFKPRFNSLETISRMTWFELQDHLDILNRDTEQASLERVVSGLNDDHAPATDETA